MEKILAFISQFDGAQDVFLNGCCYWFAYILQTRFGGEILYEPLDGHFVTRICGELYDVSGNVTSIYGQRQLIDWANYAEVDPSHYKRLVRDCVLKEGD